MQSAIRVETTVLPGHRVEVYSPELPEGRSVEVIVLLPSPRAAPARQSILEFLDSLPAGPRSHRSWEEFESSFQEERDSWER